MDDVETKETQYERNLNHLLWSLAARPCWRWWRPAAAKPAGDTIKIGEFASLTGKEATFGISSHEGTLLAIEEINAAGGVLGKKLELLTEDTQSKAGEPATVVNKLISRDGVVGSWAKSLPAVRSKPRPSVSKTRFRWSPRLPPIPKSPKSAITSSASASSIRFKAR
jgi:hypothetical protein